YYPESLRIFEKRSWVINRRTEIAGCSLTILDRKPVVAAVPFQSLMTDTECVSVRGGNYSSALCSPALRSRKIEPRADFAARRRHVIETYINVVLRVIASVGNDVGSGAGEICQRHFANPNIPILNPSAVTTHVRDIEIVDVRLITPVISLTGPKLGARLTLQYIANLNEGFTQPELIVTDASRKIRIAGRVRGIGFNHKLRLYPGLIGVVFRVHPVVDKDELGICFSLISQSVFRIGSGGLKGDLLPTPAVVTVTGTKIPVKFKGFYLFFQLLDLGLGVPQQVVGRSRRKLSLKCLLALASKGSLFGLLHRKLCCRNSPFSFRRVLLV